MSNNNQIKIKDFSLAIPMKNSAKYLPQLFSAIDNQSHIPEYLFFIDDNSDDQTNELVRKFINRSSHTSMRLIKNEKTLGIASTYNKCINVAKGQWLQILDGDDYPTNNYYLYLVSCLDCTHNVIATAMTTNNIMLNALTSFFSAIYIFRYFPSWMPILGSFVTRSGLIYSLPNIKNCLFVNPSFDGSDIIHLLRIIKNKPIRFCRKSKLFYRIHKTSSSSFNAGNDFKYLYMIKKVKNICKLFIIDYFLRKRFFSFLR